MGHTGLTRALGSRCLGTVDLVVGNEIDGVRLGDPRQAGQLAIGPRRQRQSHQRLRQHSAASWRSGGEVCEGTLRALIYCQTAGDITDTRHMVIPVNRIAAFGFGHPTPVFNVVKRAVIKWLVPEVSGFQHDRRRTADEAVLRHRTAIRDGRGQARCWLRRTDCLAMDTRPAGSKTPVMEAVCQASRRRASQLGAIVGR